MLSFKYFIFALFTGLIIGCDNVGSNDENNGNIILDLSQPWETVTPDEAGVDGGMLATAEAKAEAIPRLISMMTVHKGKIVQEAYFHGATQSTLLDVRSVTKSIIGTMVGAMLEAGLIDDIDETLQEHLTDEWISLNEANEDISIRHMLTMSSGFAWDETTSNSYTQWIQAGDHVQYVLDLPMPNPPGNTFTYNSGAVHLLGVLLEEATPSTLEQLADSLLFHPLGITSLRWERLTRGYVNGGAGIDLRTRDLARIGQLYLQEGVSGDEQILPENWVREATTPRFGQLTQNGPLANITYGYLWWIVQDQPEPAYFAWGFGGQYIYVVPTLELVVVTTTTYSGVSQDEGGNTALEAAVMEIVINDIVAATR